MSIQRDSIVSKILPTVTYRGPDETFTKHLQCRLKSLDSDSAASTEKEEEAEPQPNNELFYEYLISPPSPGSPEPEIITNGSHECEEETPSTETKKLEKVEEEEEEEEIRIPRVRRCSSLKSGKTPPGTPGQKKIVRFADVLGLDLADVRTYLDEIPKIPTSAYDDLCDVEIEVPVRQKPEKILLPLFQQPGGNADFLDRVREKQCCLENACVQDTTELSITGTVRVRNIDFYKSVHVRYSLDAWQTYSDLKATYVQNSCDGFSDKFSFIIYCHTLDIGQRIEFAIRYSTSGNQFWDNNSGVNYCFQCLPAINNTARIPLSEPQPWKESFY